jgi:hypothetical protein
MKLALLIGLDAERRSGFPLTPVALPFDQALKDFKGMVEAGVGPAPQVQLWSAGGLVKQARFKTVQPPKSGGGAKGSKAELQKQVEDLQARVAELEQDLEAARKPAEGEGSQEPELGLDGQVSDSPLVPQTAAPAPSDPSE